MTEATEVRTEAEKKKLRPDWTHECEICGEKPVVPVTGMCGPCTFGEAATIHGGWWDEKKEEPK